MREFLEDAHEHMQDGYGRAQKHAGPELRKRFYEDVAVTESEGQFGISLDGRPVKTPSMKPVSVPRRDIAQAVADEWAAQTDVIDPRLMPHMRLVNAAVEGGPETAEMLANEITNYAGNDLLIYRAEHPEELVVEQEKVWGGLLGELQATLGLVFEPTEGIIHKEQSKQSLDGVRSRISPLDHFALTALMSVTNLTGSGILALMLSEQLAQPDAIWTAAHVDEDHNIRLWGEDEEVKFWRAQRRKEFDAAVSIVNAMRAER